jgi:hypothetical protein
MTMYVAKWSDAQRLRKIMGALVMVCAVMLAAGQMARAELANTAEMQQIAENCVQEITFQKDGWAGVDKPTIAGVHELRSGDSLLARYYSISPRGFVLVPVLKEMAPIAAFSDESDLDEAQEGGFLAMVTEVLSQRLGLYASRFGSLDAVQPPDGEGVFGRGQKELWKRYGVSSDEFKASLAKGVGAKAAGPLLTTSWHQRDPYNQLCPIGYSGRSVVGCVATAAAQLMAYWKWPATGYSSYSYWWAGDTYCGYSTPGAQLTADFSDPYDWANIPDSCDAGCTPDQQAALSELNYEVGVAYNMDYSSCGSAASVARGLTVYPTWFKYSPDITLERRSNHTLESWYQTIQEEVDAGRPIQYRINLHSIVCDGYRESGGLYQYHMNYGWGGAFTAWYTLDSLYCYWILPDSVCPAGQEFMLTHIKPQTEPVLAMTGHSFDDGDHDGMLEPGEQVHLTVTIRNGGIDAQNVVGQLQTSDPYVQLTSATTSFGAAIAWGGSGVSQTDFVFSVSPSCPNSRVALFEMDMSCDVGYATTDTILMYLGTLTGFEDSMDSGEGLWRHRAFTTSFADEWHQETYRAHSGATSWKAGGTASGLYTGSSDGSLMTPPFLLPPNATLSFWHWIDAEVDAAPGMAWDGAVVMISSGDGQWTQITPVDGYPYSIVDNVASPFAPETPCFSGTADWSEAIFDLSSRSGVVQLMFRFGSDGASEQEGWYIDDVVVTGTGCCTGPSVGNVDNSADLLITMGDLTVLIDHLFISLTPLACPEAGNVDMSADNLVTMGDLTVLIDHLFISLTDLPPCP